MSSLRNAVKRITHKERSQPQHRSHLGILEKKKDYKERAIQYHNKEDKINNARKKAAFRNPDEFYFGMKNAQVNDDGKHRKTIEAEQKEFEAKVGTDTIRIMKDQDISYIRMQRQKDIKKIERLQSSLHFIDYSDTNSTSATASRKRKHIIFVDSKEKAQSATILQPRQEMLATMSLLKAGNNPNDPPSTAAKMPKVSDLVKLTKQSKKDAQRAAKARAASYSEMEARVKRVKALERAEAHLITEKLVASKGRKRKIVPAENGMPAIYKWRRKRLG
jgi:U3 small nucleolar RNA-associated protein 11